MRLYAAASRASNPAVPQASLLSAGAQISKTFRKFNGVNQAMLNQLRYRFAMFMQGRYGTDQLSRFLSAVVIVLLILRWIGNFVLAFPGVRLFFSISGFAIAILLFLIYFRTFSRNIPRRYAENRKFLELKDRAGSLFHRNSRTAGQRIEYHIYRCPQCSQKIRIPRGKGRIMVRCPRCGVEFMKQS